MTDMEARLRATLQEALDPVVADGGRAAATVRRARRGRVVRGVAAGLAGVLVAGAAAIAFERREPDDRPRPAGPRPQVMTFALDFDAGGGTLTVDVPKAQVCIDFPKNAVGPAAELRYDEGPAFVVVDYLPVSRQPACQPFDPSDARRIIAEPGRHHVAIGLGERVSLDRFEPAQEDVPDAAVVVCSQDGAVALTPEVQPRRDGVHLRFFNPSRRWRAFNLVMDNGDNEGGRLSYGSDYNVSGFGPGRLYAGCFERLYDAPMSPRDPRYTSFEIVDPLGLWTDVSLDCDTPEEPRRIPTDVPFANEQPDYEAMIRGHVPGLEPDDVLERPRYPETEFHFEPRMVVRDGRRVAVLMLVRDEPYWKISAQACPGSGIGRR